MSEDEGWQQLRKNWPCREKPLRELRALLNPTLPSPSTIVAYGTKATGKSSVVQNVLSQGQHNHVIVPCRECVTGRHLLERIVAAVRSAVTSEQRNGSDGVYAGRCENLNALGVILQRLLRDQDRFVLVLDGIDRQRDAPPTLLPAIARLGEQVPSLTVIFVLRHPTPGLLDQAGIPYVHFPPYTREQSIHVLSREPPLIFLEPPPPELEYDDEVHDEDRAWLWPRFCAAVWDSAGQSAARNLSSFKEVCERLWRPFVAPIIKGDFGTRDFARLLVAQRRLFQEDSILQDSIVSADQPAKARTSVSDHELPYYAKWILVAAYLASFNPTRLDPVYFMKSTDKKRKKRAGGRPSQARKIPRLLLAPATFGMDRLLSILHAILPHPLRSTIDLPTQIQTLTSLRLLMRTAGIGTTDPLEPGGKWRVGAPVTLEYAQNLSRGLDFTLLDFLAE